MSSFRLLTVFATGVLLAACGFEPLYGSRGPAAVVTQFAYVQVAPIEDRVGQQLRNELVHKLYAAGRARVPKFRLVTRVNESTTSLAVQKNALATRANLIMSATYQLIDTANGRILDSATNSVTVSYNILDSEFATKMAERDAKERAVKALSEDMRIRLAVYFRRPK